MYDLEYYFDEVAFCVGKYPDGKRQSIALISGLATINVYGKGQWEIAEVTIDNPITAADSAGTTKFTVGHPLWDALVESITHDCADHIYDETVEICQPDPDAAYDLMREGR